MSVSFTYTPAGVETTFDYGTSNDQTVLEEVFGMLPREFGEGNLSTLRAMAAAQGIKHSVFGEIADKIEEIGTILVSAQY